MKEKSDVLYREHELVRKKLNELQDVNNILTKQHEDDQTLIEDVKATNMMLREALETKELEWGTSDGQLANFAPKESLLGEIEQHFNRFQVNHLSFELMHNLDDIECVTTCRRSVLLCEVRPRCLTLWMW